MPDCPVSGLFGTGMKKKAMPEPVSFRTNTGIFWSDIAIEFMDAGIPMPVLLFSVPMPSYGSSI
jgi:hypothetical protein